MPTSDFWWGYFVGLYEGEGTRPMSSFKANPNRIYARLRIRMTDRKPLENVQRLLGGVLADAYLAPSRRGSGDLPQFRWEIGRVNEFLRISQAILPFLSPRRQEQISEALEVVVPNTKRIVRAGSRRDGTAQPYRPRQTGELVCPAEPEPSCRGYHRHRLLGIPVCDICRASFRLYYNERNKWRRDKISNLPLAEQDALRIRQREYTRRWKAKQRIAGSDPTQRLTPN